MFAKVNKLISDLKFVQDRNKESWNYTISIFEEFKKFKSKISRYELLTKGWKIKRTNKMLKDKKKF